MCDWCSIYCTDCEAPLCEKHARRCDDCEAALCPNCVGADGRLCEVCRDNEEDE